MSQTAVAQVPAPQAEQVKRYFFENAVVGDTTRFRQLSRYEAHYACNQYAHLQFDWWGLSADQLETVSPSLQVPLGFNQPALQLLARQKRPTAPYHLAKAIVDRFTGLLFSETRKPDVEVEGDPSTDDFLHACMEQCRFWARWREARTIGGASGSVLMTMHLRRGRFVIQSHNPKHVQMLWKDRRALDPHAALILYRYPQEEYTRDPKTGEMTTKVVEYLYRRIITEVDDTVYVPVKLEPASDLKWEVESCVTHNLGFFPGVWVQNKPVTEQEDGDPDCQGAWQTFDTIDRLLAQMNKSLLLNMDPTLVLKLDPKEVLAQGNSVRKGSENALYVGSQGNANYLEMQASGIERAGQLVDRLKQNALDVCRCVLIEPEKISGSAQSAKAMEYLYAPMLEQADELRSQWGDNGIIPMLRMMERMAREVHGRRLVVANKEFVQKLDLPPKADGTPRTIGPGGWIRLKWGQYFSPTETDRQTEISNVTSAKSGGLIDKETAVNRGAVIFAVQDAKAMFEKIKREEAEEASRMFGTTFEPPPDEIDETPPGAGDGGKP